MTSTYNTNDLYDIYNIDYSLRSSGIIIVNQEYQKLDPLVDYKHHFDGLLLSFMTQGYMRAHINFQEYTVEKGNLIVVLPQLLIEPLDASKDAKMITIGISLDFLSNFPILGNFITNNQIRWQPIVELNQQDLSTFEDLFLLLKKVFLQHNQSKKTEALQYLTFALLSLLSETYSRTPENKSSHKTRKHKIIDNFYVLVTQYASTQRSVTFYAEKLHLTPQYLTTLLKKDTGKSVLQWIDHYVILHAKSLLRATNTPIKEVSSLLSFNDTSLFCRYFKRHTGTSPKRFRIDQR